MPEVTAETKFTSLSLRKGESASRYEGRRLGSAGGERWRGWPRGLMMVAFPGPSLRGLSGYLARVARYPGHNVFGHAAIILVLGDLEGDASRMPRANTASHAMFIVLSAQYNLS